MVGQGSAVPEWAQTDSICADTVPLDVVVSESGLVRNLKALLVRRRSPSKLTGLLLSARREVSFWICWLSQVGCWAYHVLSHVF